MTSARYDTSNEKIPLWVNRLRTFVIKPVKLSMCAKTLFAVITSADPYLS